MADSDSKSIHWTDDTIPLGHHFTRAAQKAKLSMRSWAGARSSPPPWASLHRCPGSDDAWALGIAGTWVPLCLKAGPKWAHSQHHPVALRTLPLCKGRLWPQNHFWQQSSFFSLKPCHRLDLERDIFLPTHKLFFPPFSCEAPSAFQLVIALVRLNGLAGEITSLLFLSWSCLNSYKSI